MMCNIRIPSIMIAGTHSGVGKTTVSMGIMAALSKKLRVQPFKVGPDFIDPTHHTAICGRASRNLDTYMMGEKGVRDTFASAAKGADIAVIEGAMGLYDGMDTEEIASSAHVAKVLGIPVILVLNASGMSRSAAALVTGYREFDKGVRIAAVIVNNAGSQKHADLLKKAIDKTGIEVLGAIPRSDSIKTPSRHLGLHMAHETSEISPVLAGLVENHVNLDRLRMIADTGSDTAYPAISEPEDDRSIGEAAGKNVTIGVAWDEAFRFYYHDSLDALRKSGAELVFFSPMAGSMPDVDGLYLGGGYPELYAEKLTGSRIRDRIKHAASDGMPVYGECGGLLYLSESIEVAGKEYRMAGVLGCMGRMEKRHQALGYAEAVAVSDCPVLKGGMHIRGHEFHYSSIECRKDARFAYRMIRGSGIVDGKDCMTEYSTAAGYMHAHPASFSFDRFVGECERYGRK